MSNTNMNTAAQIETLNAQRRALTAGESMEVKHEPAADFAARLRAADLTYTDWHTLALVQACGPVCSETLTFWRTGKEYGAIAGPGRDGSITWRSLERLRDAGLIRLESRGWEAI